MKRRIAYIISLLLMAQLAAAQTVSRYEYWVDNDYAGRHTGHATQAEENISFQLDINGLTDGIHLLYMRAANSAGQVSGFKHWLFYKPEALAADVNLTGYEYWIDNDYANRTRTASSNSNPSFMVDISNLTPGVHMMYCRAMNDAGVYGVIKNWLFYKPEASDADANLTGFEYWIDNDYANCTRTASSNANQSFMVDITGLSSGVHMLYSRAINDAGTYGLIKNWLFYKPSESEGDDEVSGYEYWIDNDYAGRTVWDFPPEEPEYLFIDTDDLKQGVHQLYFRVFTKSGKVSQVYNWMFYTPDYNKQEVVESSPLVGYRYNFNGVSTYEEIPECNEYDMNGYLFDIPELTQMARVDEDCNFTFDSNTDSVVMTRSSNLGFGLQFQTKDGGWSAPATYAWEEDDTIRRKAVPLSLQQTVTFDKRHTGDFEVIRLDVSKGGTYYLSASQACKLMLFNAKDGSLYRTVQPEEITGSYRTGITVGTYYGIVTQTVTDQDNPADVISIRFMQTNNFVATPVISYENEIVTFSCEKAGATLYYTLDGTDPTEQSSVYMEPFEFKHNGTIKVVAKYDGLADSYIAVLKVNDYTVINPSIQFANLKVYITTATENARIYYTTDGSDPLESGILYSDPFSVPENCTVKAVAKRDGYNDSKVVSRFVDVTSVKCVAATYSVKDNKLTIVTLSDGAVIHYTMDGTIPTAQSPVYTAPIDLEMNGIVRTIVIKEGWIDSSVSDFTIDWFRLDPPALNFSEQTHLVTITAARPEAVVYYTIGGGLPTTQSTRYSEPFLLDHNDTIIAVGVCDHFNDSYPDTLVVNSYKVANPVIERVNGKMQMTSTTDGAQIFYTIDGKDPLTDGTVYTEPVVIDVICSVRAIAVRNGYNNSDEVHYDLGKCAAPKFECADNVLTLTTTTQDAVIYYTIDGSTPGTGSTLYANPIRLERNVVVKAIACKDDMVDSDSAVYTVDWFKVETPEFAFTNGVLAIFCATSGSEIRYEIGGTEPGDSSTLYTGPIVLTDNKVVKAFAKKADFNNSETASYTPEFFACTEPVISRVNGLMQMTCTTDDVQILYTTDGSNPLTNGKVYSDPVSLNEVCTIKAIAIKDWFNNSTVAVFNLDKCVMPAFECKDNTLTISTTTEGATIYYTIDGSAPTMASTVYSTPITLERNLMVRAFAVLSSMIDSDIKDYAVDWFTVETPSFTFNEGVLAISCATPGSVIYYEIGGAKPTTQSAVYSVPLSLTDNREVRAFAVKTDFNNSQVGSYKPDYYTCAAPQITFDGRSVTMTTATDNSKIYFTVNGQDPDTNSELYTSARLLSGLCTVKAYTVRDNFNDSEISTFTLPCYYNGDIAYVSKPGTMSKAFEWCGTTDIESLSVSGKVSQSDFRFIRGIHGLKYLNMEAVKIDSLYAGALSGTDLVSFISPTGLKWVGEDVLKGCNALAAVQWKADINVPDDLLGEDKKPNMLLYVNSGSYVRAGVFTNVIVNGVTDVLTLTDSENSDFWCPVEFTARKAIYTHNYTMATQKGECTGWESIALPFTVSTITHAQNGAMAPFGVASADDKPFWLEELTSNGFVPANQIKANTPYIICMPNDPQYADKYILAGEVTFQGVNVKVEATNDIKISAKGNVQFVPNYSNSSSNGRSQLNVGTDYQGHKQGSLFVKDLRRLRPFEAYVVSGSQMVPIRDMLGGTTGINSIFLPNYGATGVYDMNGRKLTDEEFDSIRIHGNDDNRLLIIDGRKVLIR